MSNQVQCPNCGGYKVRNEGSESIGRFEGEGLLFKKIRVPGVIGCLIVIAAVAFALYLSVSLMGWFANRYDEGDILTPIIVIAVILVGFISYVRWYGKHYYEESKQYSYECYLCGYKWTWRTDEPWPQVHVRPDLIEKGEQRLEEEKRRREEEYRHAGMWMNKK